jgi:ABC-type transport system substrate-binding protein
MRRTGLFAAAVVTTALLLGACGGGGSSGGGSQKASLTGLYGASTVKACQATPVRGGTLVYERQAETQTLDPIHIVNANGDIFAYNLIYSGLVRSPGNVALAACKKLANVQAAKHSERKP